MSRRRALLLAAISLSLSTTSGLGCVSSGKYDALQRERDTLAQERAQLEQRVDELTAAQERLLQDVEVKQQEVAELARVQDRLAGELATEVAMRQVDVQRLVDGIRLNVSEQLLFASGSAALSDAGRDLLKRIVSQLDPKKQIISVVGHADSYKLPARLREKYPTNWELAAARATIVVRVLSEAGIPGASLRAVSRGPFEPIATNETPEGRAQNRRTEIIVRQDPRAK